MLVDRTDIDLNLWYSVDDITGILTMQRYKVRAVLAEHKSAINNGLLLPNLVKTGKGWQITGRGLITLLDILGKAKPITKGKRERTMTRKSFTQNDNPALKFLDDVTEQKDNTVIQEQKKDEQELASSRNDIQASREQELAVDMASNYDHTKQEWKQVNPLDFITPKKEKKTARVQLVLTPSLLSEVKSYAKSNGLSVNDFVSQLLESVLHK